MNDSWIKPLISIFIAVSVVSICGVLTFIALAALGIVKAIGG